MKLKINKACDLSSISVLPPQSRRSSMVSGGLESSSVFGRNQTPSELRPQQPQQSQLTLSQGVSSQHGLFSQFSQNSQDEILTTEKTVSQERENSVRRTSCLPPINYTREESQIVASRTSNNLMRKWSGQEYRSGQISEELEHRIGMIETSLNRLAMILDSVQSDIMQVNKGTKEVALEMEGVRQKLIAHDDSLQSMSKGQEDIKVRLDVGLKSLSDQLEQIKNQENLGEITPMLSALSEKIDTQMVKLQNNLHEEFCKEIQAMSHSMKTSKQKQATPSMHVPKAVICHAPQGIQFPNNTTRHLKVLRRRLPPKVEMEGWTSVKQEQATSKVGNLIKKSSYKKVSPNQLEWRVIIDSDEEIDGGFSCLLKEKGTKVEEYSMEKAKEETARILRKARRKRKYSNTIIIN